MSFIELFLLKQCKISRPTFDLALDLLSTRLSCLTCPLFLGSKCYQDIWFSNNHEIPLKILNSFNNFNKNVQFNENYKLALIVKTWNVSDSKRKKVFFHRKLHTLNNNPKNLYFDSNGYNPQKRKYHLNQKEIKS